MEKTKLFYRTIRYFLFKIDPESVHHFVSYFIKIKGFLFLFFKPKRSSQVLDIDLCNVSLFNPIAMAAGFDKNGDMVNGLNSFGFGFTEVGTFTKKIQTGNPRPRLFRVPSQYALFNRMGFNNPGIEKGLENLRNARFYFAVSIGKSKETPVEQAVDDYVEILKTIELSRYKDVKKKIIYIAINISSPNTPGLRLLQNKKYIKDLIDQCKKTSDLPLFIKFSPDFSSIREFETTLHSALKAGINGVIVTNTTSDETITRYVADDIRKAGGGLSGLPLAQKSELYLKSALKICKGKVPVISSGAVMSKEDILRRLQWGASVVQVYTGFIYNGPTFVKDCLKYVISKINESGYPGLIDYQKKFIQRKSK
ncbi:MAG: quinone-dependent dihydroorotate dehydrogenase [Spirochaetia bacterium]|nr:quinone-dependent dihydroorotate dehydrogenase [Spirochaetia bacterium]